jgi:hypothetical protein
VLKDYAAELSVVQQDFAAAWCFFRDSGVTLIEEARHQLVMLGKID